ncbi:MAG: hypothetical protein KCHDKBKB_01419 [Elusimicrobia bacterium]|nr:hypothetical protein [Elusimicrobiota bacterium]
MVKPPTPLAGLFRSPVFFIHEEINLKKAWHLVRETLLEGRKDNLSIFAAGFSYYLLFSIIPLIVVVLTVVGKIIETHSASLLVVQELSFLFNEEMANSFKEFLLAAAEMKVSEAGILGFLLVIYAAMGIFSILQRAISQIWDKEEKRKGGFRGVVTTRLHSAILLSLPIFLVMICFVIDTLFSTFKHTVGRYVSLSFLESFYPLVAYLFSLGLFATVFVFINRLIPVRKPSWKDVWVGAVITMIVFALGKLIFTTLLHFSQVRSLFGAAGSLILVLMWIYFSMMVFLYGSEFTRIYAKKHGSGMILDV